MTKLNEIQSLLLSTAAQRAEGNLLPYPPTVTEDDARVSKAIAALLKRGLAVERETSDLLRSFAKMASYVSDCSSPLLVLSRLASSPSHPHRSPLPPRRMPCFL